MTQKPEDNKLDRAEKMAIAKAIVALTVLLIFIIFVVKNASPVRVDFVFFDAQIRLIWVFLGCGAIGAAIAWLARERWNMQRARRKKKR